MTLRQYLIAAIMLLAFATTSNAVIIIDFNQVGDDVVVSGNGTLDFTGLSYLSKGTVSSTYINPSIGNIATKVLFNGSFVYEGVSNPASFGSGGSRAFDSITTNFGLTLNSLGYIFIEETYAGEVIDFTGTFLNETIATLGTTPGTYTWSWAGDYIELNVEAAEAPVPEPATMLLLGSGLAGLAGLRRKTNKA